MAESFGLKPSIRNSNAILHCSRSFPSFRPLSHLAARRHFWAKAPTNALSSFMWRKNGRRFALSRLLAAIFEQRHRPATASHAFMWRRHWPAPPSSSLLVSRSHSLSTGANQSRCHMRSCDAVSGRRLSSPVAARRHSWAKAQVKRTLSKNEPRYLLVRIWALVWPSPFTYFFI